MNHLIGNQSSIFTSINSDVIIQSLDHLRFCGSDSAYGPLFPRTRVFNPSCHMIIILTQVTHILANSV